MKPLSNQLQTWDWKSFELRIETIILPKIITQIVTKIENPIWEIIDNEIKNEIENEIEQVGSIKNETNSQKH